MADSTISPGVQVLTSDGIFFELSGKRIAGVESYSTRYSNDVKMVDAFGQDTSIGYTLGSKKYTVDISRAYLEDTAIADGISFYDLQNFNFDLVIIKNGERTVYKSCVISEIGEDGSLKDKVVEKITLQALSRVKE